MNLFILSCLFWCLYNIKGVGTLSYEFVYSIIKETWSLSTLLVSKVVPASSSCLWCLWSCQGNASVTMPAYLTTSRHMLKYHLLEWSWTSRSACGKQYGPMLSSQPASFKGAYSISLSASGARSRTLGYARTTSMMTEHPLELSMKRGRDQPDHSSRLDLVWSAPVDIYKYIVYVFYLFYWVLLWCFYAFVYSILTLCFIFSCFSLAYYV